MSWVAVCMGAFIVLGACLLVYGALAAAARADQVRPPSSDKSLLSGEEAE